jgi:NAD+ kinase
MPASARFQQIALIGRHEDSRVAQTLAAIVLRLREHGCHIVVPAGMELPVPGGVQQVDAAALASGTSLMVAVGGDGTMLHAARFAAPSGIPLLGVNYGRLGFLADVGPQEVISRLDEVMAGEYVEEHRAMLHARIDGREDSIIGCDALNDVVLHKWQTGRMLEFETWIDGQFVNSHFGDGLVIATATGSTAYALSCGGPILHPGLDAWVLAPICPHTLSDRPIVIRDTSRIEIRLTERLDCQAQVTCDGESICELAATDRLVVERAKSHLTLLHPRDHSYFRVLRSKLRWGRGDRAHDTTASASER